MYAYFWLFPTFSHFVGAFILAFTEWYRQYACSYDIHNRSLEMLNRFVVVYTIKVGRPFLLFNCLGLVMQTKSWEH